MCGDPNKAVRIVSRNGDVKLTIPKVSEFMRNRAPMVKSRSETGGGEENCSCSQVSDWCDIFDDIPSSVISCNKNNFRCKVVSPGCGAFWQFTCDGICKSPSA